MFLVEGISAYDLNGNILGLRRYGKLNPGNIAGAIDMLEYTYEGNRLIAVDDAVTNNNGGDFYDNGQYYYLTHTQEYAYDANGNLTKDINKGVINISYNNTNLPTTLEKEGGTLLEYQYDAAGNKLRQLEYTEGKLVKTTDFVANFVYINGKTAWNSFDEGRIVYSTFDNTYYAENHLKDHLGNVRVAFAFEGSSLKIKQVNSYYPFGMNIKELSLNEGRESAKYYRNEYLYNGKMMQDETGLNWLDYGARFYDPVLGRWHSVDPLAEKNRKWSPFNYCVNNPIRYIDPDGMDWNGPSTRGYDWEGNYLREDEPVWYLDIYITGPAAEEATKQLDESTSLNITKDEDGKLSASGDALTKDDNLLLAAINDKDIKVNITATEEFAKRDKDGKIIVTNGGSFLGAKLTKSSTSYKVNSFQKVIPSHLSKMDTYAHKNGAGMLHESIESYQAAKISLAKNQNSIPGDRISAKAHKLGECSMNCVSCFNSFIKERK